MRAITAWLLRQYGYGPVFAWRTAMLDLRTLATLETTNGQETPGHERIIPL